MFKLSAKIFLKDPLFVLNSRIRDIDTCAGDNDRGTLFSTEPLYFLQDLAKDLFRFITRLELFHPFVCKKKASLF